MADRGSSALLPVDLWCRRLLVLLLLSASVFLSAAAAQTLDPQRRFQDFVQDVWSLQEGLPQITVTAIAQDDEGYIWVGTQQGLSRFDGVRFQDFGRDAVGDIPGAFVQALHRDRQGRLWIGTYKGVSLYHQRRFEPVPLAGSDPVAEITVRGFAPLADESMLVAADEGLFRYLDGELLRVQTPEPGPVTALEATEAGVWVGTLGQIWLFDGAAFVRQVSLPAGMELVSVDAMAMHDSALWLATPAGLLRGAESPVFVADVPERLTGVPVDALYNDSSETLWVGTAQALLRFHQGRLLEVIDNDHPRAHPQVQSIYEDREGNLWMGGFLDGLARYWSGWAEHFHESQGLSDPLVWSVAATAGDDALWVGSNDGLSRLREGRFEHWLDGSDLPHPHAYTLHVEPGSLWIGTRRGLVRMDTDSGQLEAPAALQALAPYQINGIVPAGVYGRFFLLTNHGLFLWDGDQQLQPLRQGIGTRMVRQMRLENDRHLIVATDSGAFYGQLGQLQRFGASHGVDADADFAAIHRLDPHTLILASIDAGVFVGDGESFRALTMSNGLPSQTSYFATDDGEHLWSAGFQGLYRVTLASLRAFAEGRSDQVDAEMILSESGAHAGSQQALCCNGAGHAKGLLREDGLWLPTRGGVARVRSEAIWRNPVAPAVLVERLRFSDAWHQVLPGQQFELPLGERDLQFEFTALSFQDPRSVRLSYRLRGYDNDWHDPGVARSAAYTNLPPGQYAFEVKAANNAGIWSEHPAVLEFSIGPHFHETGWFYLVPLSLLFLLVALGYQWRLRQWRRRELRLASMVEARTRDLNASRERAEQALHQLKQTQGELIEAEKMASVGRLVTGMAHEINTPLGNSLTLTSSLADRTYRLENKVQAAQPLARSQLTGYLSDTREALALVMSNLNRATHLMRSFKRLAGEPVSDGPSSVDMEGFLASLRSENKARLESFGVSLEWHCSAGLSQRCDREVLGECLNQLIDNSLAHAFESDRAPAPGERRIRIDALARADGLQIDYADNGDGIDARTREHIFEPFYASMRKTEHAGVGMHMVFNLVQRVLAGRIECLPAEQGAHFQLCLPDRESS